MRPSITKELRRRYGGDWWYDWMRCWICQETGRIVRRDGDNYFLHTGKDVEKIDMKSPHLKYKDR